MAEIHSREIGNLENGILKANIDLMNERIAPQHTIGEESMAYHNEVYALASN
jgi:hypothetical protein